MDYNKNFQEILACVPDSYEVSIDWERIERTQLGMLLREMKATFQDPEYHAEGDVYCHSKCVCEELIKLPEYRDGSKEDKTVLFLSALLHDAGKIKCTRTEGGKTVSPGHASKGSLMIRELLWKEFGLCGTKEKQQLRECICFLIKYHSFPPYALNYENSEHRILRIASVGNLVKPFTLRKLCILSKADILGRECCDKQDYLERTDYCKSLAEELRCIDQPFEFRGEFSRRAYFSEKTRWHEQEMFNNTWGRVILMSGLPGTGKDTWISENYPDLPMISLDEIRKQLNIRPTHNQGKVIAIAEESAKEYLRKKQPFIWNATNTTEQIRERLITLFEQYAAGVEIVFLETEWEEQLRRNSDRSDVVPREKIEKMLSKLDIPQTFESEKVRWETT